MRRGRVIIWMGRRREVSLDEEEKGGITGWGGGGRYHWMGRRREVSLDGEEEGGITGWGEGGYHWMGWEEGLERE